MPVTDQSIEKVVGFVLRTGVITSGLIVLLGGIYFLTRHSGEPADYHIFKAQTFADHYIPEILRGTLRLEGRSIIQLGVLCLIATPIVRVLVSLIGFALARDWAYVLITSIVLAVLLYSLISGAAGAA